MAASSGISRCASWLAEAANHDFCPQLNRYLYWLKDPIGWFFLATLASLLVGAFLSPLGWMVAAGLIAIQLVGLGLPWVIVRSVDCRLQAGTDCVHERQACELNLQVRNPLPLPIIGLIVEGYLVDVVVEEDGTSAGSERPIGLAQVPALSTALYPLTVRHEYRGRYPRERPRLACSFPFGIWTARRPLSSVEPLTVRPLVLPLRTDWQLRGARSDCVQTGHSPSQGGDFLGVRDFRRGDRLRSIHWAHSARTDSLVVCERGVGQLPTVEVRLATAPVPGTVSQSRDNLAWRVRVAASLLDLAVARRLPFRLYVDDQPVAAGEGRRCLTRAWDRLADIPLDGCASPPALACTIHSGPNAPPGIRLVVTAPPTEGSKTVANTVLLQIQSPSDRVGRRADQIGYELKLDEDLSLQLDQLLTEASRECFAA